MSGRWSSLLSPANGRLSVVRAPRIDWRRDPANRRVRSRAPVRRGPFAGPDERTRCRRRCVAAATERRVPITSQPRLQADRPSAHRDKTPSRGSRGRLRTNCPIRARLAASWVGCFAPPRRSHHPPHRAQPPRRKAKHPTHDAADRARAKCQAGRGGLNQPGPHPTQPFLDLAAVVFCGRAATTLGLPPSPMSPPSSASATGFGTALGPRESPCLARTSRLDRVEHVAVVGQELLGVLAALADRDRPCS